MYTSRTFNVLPQASRSIRNKRKLRRSRRRTEAILQVVVLEDRAVPSLLGQSLFPRIIPTKRFDRQRAGVGKLRKLDNAMAATRSTIVNWGAYTPGAVARSTPCRTISSTPRTQ